MSNNKITPTHPGKLLYTEFLAPHGLTAAEVSRATGIPNSRLSEVFSGRRSITADTAIRIGRLLELDPQSFINLQAHYDLVTTQAALDARRPPLKIPSLRSLIPLPA
jgi:addiction module HigA family antidote